MSVNLGGEDLRIDMLRKGIKHRCARIRKSAGATTRSWLATARLILELNQWLRDAFSMKRSDTVTFVQEEAGLSRRSVYYYLRGGEVFGDLQPAEMERLEIGAILLLSARTVKPEIQQRARELLKEGPVTVDVARELLGKRQATSRSARRRISLGAGSVIVIESTDAEADLMTLLRQALAKLESEAKASSSNKQGDAA